MSRWRHRRSGNALVAGWYYHGRGWEYNEYECEDYYFLAYLHTYHRERVIIQRIALDYWKSLGGGGQEELRMAFVRKREELHQNGRRCTDGLDPKWAEKYPALWEHLTTGQYEDGSLRTLSTLSWFLGLEGLTVCLQDRDNHQSLFASGETWAAALGVLEQLAQKGDKAPWRADRRETGQSNRVNKR